MFFTKKKEIIEELEEIEIDKINDIEAEKFEEEVDISSVFIISKAKTLISLFKKNTSDLKNGLKDIKSLYKEKKIKLIKITKPLTDLRKNKKNLIININTYKPKKDKDTLNLLDIENFKREVGPYSDIYFPKYPLHIRTFIAFKKGFKNLKNISKIKVFVFSSIILAIIFSGIFYKNLVENKINTIITEAKTISLNDDISTTKNKIENLKFDIITLKFMSNPIFLANIFLKIEDVENLKNVIDGASAICDSALNIIFVYDSLDINIKNKGIDNFYVGEFIKNSQTYLMSAFTELNAGISYLENVKFGNDKNLEKSYNEKISDLKEFRDLFSLFMDNFENIKNILGDEKKRTYMVVFQNSDEIRPTGGFMGSVLFFDVFRGKITKYEKKDIYALEWGQEPYLELVPEGLSEISKTFSLRDANYYPDIEKSSLKIKEFLDKTDYNIDGIVYINQNIILDFLDYFGGIYFDEIKKELNSSNFSMMTSTLVESKLYKEGTLGTPKQILFDFVMTFFGELKKKGDYSSYLKIILNGLKENEILVYDFHQEENEFFKKVGFKTDLVDSKKLDFNYPVFASISGNKSDRYIKRTFEKKVNLNKDCSVNTSFKITSKHTFDISKELDIKNFLYDVGALGKVDINAVLETQGKGLNRQFVRLYIPKDAIIDNSKNYKINVLDDRKEITFFLDTPLLFDSDFKVSYTLANIDCKTYDYELIKQPGLRGYNLEYYENGNLVNSSYIKNDFIYQK